jgi:hypothetical protein
VNPDGNGNGHEPAQAEADGSSPALDEVLVTQLRIISEQLKLLGAD